MYAKGKKTARNERKTRSRPAPNEKLALGNQTQAGANPWYCSSRKNRPRPPSTRSGVIFPGQAERCAPGGEHPKGPRFARHSCCVIVSIVSVAVPLTICACRLQRRTAHPKCVPPFSTLRRSASGKAPEGWRTPNAKFTAGFCITMPPRARFDPHSGASAVCWAWCLGCACPWAA